MQWMVSMRRCAFRVSRVGAAALVIGLLATVSATAQGVGAQPHGAPAHVVRGNSGPRETVRVTPSGRTSTAGLAAPVVLDRVTVIDVERGRRLRGQRVVIVGNRVRTMGPARAVALPSGARVVDARGKYLIPGLWDMHFHATVDWGGTPVYWRHQVNAVYRQLVASGITGIRDPGSALPLDTLRRWKREIAAAQRVGPRLVVTGPSIEHSGGFCKQDETPPRCSGPLIYIDRPEDAQRLVDSIRTAGADQVKIHNVPRPIWFALAAAARRAGIPFGGHFSRTDDGLPRTVDGLMASDSGAWLLDHSPWADLCGEDGDSVLSLTRCAAAAARLRHNGTWVVGYGGGPQLSTPLLSRALRHAAAEESVNEGQNWRPPNAAERRRLPTSADLAALLPDSARFERGCRQALLAYAADLPWLPGPDFPMAPVIGAHLSVLAPTLCGVPPWWVLKAATLEPARALRAADSLGTVAAGKVADLVLLEGDPLADIWNVTKIAAVIANGRYFDRAALDRLLSEASAEWRRAGEMRRAARAQHP